MLTLLTKGQESYFLVASSCEHVTDIFIKIISCITTWLLNFYVLLLIVRISPYPAMILTRLLVDVSIGAVTSLSPSSATDLFPTA